MNLEMLIEGWLWHTFMLQGPIMIQLFPEVEDAVII